MINNDGYINVFELLYFIVKRWKVLLIAFFIGLVGSLTYLSFFNRPTYSTSGSFVINRAINMPMVNTAAELVKTTENIKLALEYINQETTSLTDLTIEDIRSNLLVHSNIASPTINITYSSDSKIDIALILNSIIKASVEHVNTKFPIF